MNTDWVQLGFFVGVCGLATFRIWRLVARDSVLAVPRAYVAERFPSVWYWFDCPWCSGFWFGLVVAAAVWNGFPGATLLTSLFAIAGVGSLLSELLEQQEETD